MVDIYRAAKREGKMHHFHRLIVLVYITQAE